MSIQEFIVFFNPILIACIKDKFASIFFQNFNLFFSSYNVKQRNSLSLTILVEHSSQGWSCGCVDQAFSFLSMIFPFLISIDHTDNCQGINDPWGSTFDGDIWIDFPYTCNTGDSVLCPGSSDGLERYLFSDKFFMLSTTGFNDFSITLESSNKWNFWCSICSFDTESIGWVDGRGNDFDKDLVWSWLRDIKVCVGGDISQSLNN